MRICIYRKGDDSKNKCTALRLENENFADVYDFPDKLPVGTVLDPYAEKALSVDDSPPLIVVDCSWKSSRKEIKKVSGEHRALPFVVSANPVNYGKPFQLNTAESVICSLYILRHKKRALEVAEKFDYGKEFLKLNYDRLEKYSTCENSAQIIKAQEQYL